MMKIITFLLFIIVGLSVLSFPAQSKGIPRGVVKVWDGEAPNNNWDDGANWNPNGTPQVGDIVIFNETSSKNCVIALPGIADIHNVTIKNYSGKITVNVDTGDKNDWWDIQDCEIDGTGELKAHLNISSQVSLSCELKADLNITDGDITFTQSSYHGDIDMVNSSFYCYDSTVNFNSQGCNLDSNSTFISVSTTYAGDDRWKFYFGDDSSYVEFRWFLDIDVKDINGDYVNGTVNVVSSTAEWKKHQYTSTGQIDNMIVPQFRWNSTKFSNYNPLEVKVSSIGYLTETNFVTVGGDQSTTVILQEPEVEHPTGYVGMISNIIGLIILIFAIILIIKFIISYATEGVEI